jgi:hypothetical protein
MKNFLIPITAIIWYLMTYYGIYFGVLLMIFMFSLSWIWLILGFSLMVGVISTLIIGLPSVFRFLILSLYGASWLSVISHSISGLFGLVSISYFFYTSPPEFVIGGESVFIIYQMWEVAPIKTIFLAFPAIGLLLSLIWSTVISPILIKIADEDF